MKKTNTLLWLTLLCLSTIVAGCKKDKKAEQLPPATQTGANTFGCLINGVVYTPKGFKLNKPNFEMIVDPGFNDGNLDIRVYRLENEREIYLSLGSDSIKNVGFYPLDRNTGFYFLIATKGITSLICEVLHAVGSNPVGKTGFIKITRYDLANRVISGEFEFEFTNPDCGLGNPIKISQGRFDKSF